MFNKKKETRWYVIGAVIGAIGGLLVLWRMGEFKK